MNPNTFSTPPFTTTTLSGDTTLQFVSAALDSTTHNFYTFEALRGGLSVNLAVISGTPNVGSITISPLMFDSSSYSQSSAFHPMAAGTSTLSVVTPAGFTTPGNLTSTVATVNAPAISFTSTTYTVGNNLEAPAQLVLGAGAPMTPAVIITVTSNNPNVLLSASPTSAGSSSISLMIAPNQTASPQFYIQGLLDTGTAMLTAHDPSNRFTDASPAMVALTPSGAVFNPNTFTTYNFTTTTFSPDTNVAIATAQLNPITHNFAGFEAVRGGFSLIVGMNSMDPNVGTAVGSPVTFNGGDMNMNINFHPLTAGMTDLTLTQPAGFIMPNNFFKTTATVRPPRIFINGGNDQTVGFDLQNTVNVSLEVAPPNPVVVTIDSSSGTISTITINPTVAGGTNVTFNNVTTTFAGSIVVQGRSLGGTVLTGKAPGYSDSVIKVTVNPSGFTFNPNGFSSFNFTTSVGQADTPLFFLAAILDPITLNFAGSGSVRGGLTVNLPITSSDGTVGTITMSPVAFPSNTSSGSAAFHPVGNGMATLTVGLPTCSGPCGYTMPSNFNSTIATVQ